MGWLEELTAAEEKDGKKPAKTSKRSAGAIIFEDIPACSLARAENDKQRALIIICWFSPREQAAANALERNDKTMRSKG